MKIKKAASALLFCLIVSLYPISSQAHPGRTDKYGGHYVWTAGWGYAIGSYHYHNGGSTIDSDAEYKKGYKAGYKVGHKYGYNENYGEYTFNYTNDYYKNGFNEGFNIGFDDGLAAKKLFRENQLKDDFNKGVQKGLNVSLPSTTKVPSYSKDPERQLSYENGLREGIQKLLDKDYNKGLVAGSKVLLPSTESPSSYSKDIERQRQFEKGFNESVEKLIQNDYNLGYKEGKEKHLNTLRSYSNDIKRDESYKKGYVSGRQDFYIEDYKTNFEKYKNTAYEEGYNSAFEVSHLNMPETYINHFLLFISNSGAFNDFNEDAIQSLKVIKDIDDSLITKAYKNGYNANHEVEAIGSKGFADGVFFNVYASPVKGEKIYKAQYVKGRTTISTSIIVFILGLVIIFVYKKMKKQ